MRPSITGHKMEVDFSKHFSLAKFSPNTCTLAFLLNTIYYQNTQLLHDIFQMVQYSVVTQKIELL